MAGGAPDLQLDPAIRNWVLLPIFLAMFLISVARHYAQKLMRTDTKVDVKALREAQAVTRAQRLRMSAPFIPAGAVAARKAYFCAKETGVFHQKSEKLTPQQQMLTDPSAMTGMMKNNLGMMVPQVLTMAWVNYFFSGFVVAKVPFPLTQRFREMLQRGVDLQGLDVTYVSSLSWYFLNVFGINGLLQLVLGEATNVNDLQAQQQMMMMGMDTAKAYVAEREALEALRHEWALPKVEVQAAARLRRLVTHVV